MNTIIGPDMKKRSRRLIKPLIQLRLIGTFIGLSLLAFVLQATYLSTQMFDLATTLPTGGNVLESEIPGFVAKSLGVSFLILLPLTIAVGILVTFRIAGPIYRFEQWLALIAAGEEPGPCTIRKGDHLHELCEVLNEAVDHLKAEAAASDGGSKRDSERTAA